MFEDWEGAARRFLARFRSSTHHFIGETWLAELVHDLQQVSPAFRQWRSQHDVQGSQTEHKHLIHPIVGPLALQAQTFQVVDHPDLRMVVYTPVPESDTGA